MMCEYYVCTQKTFGYPSNILSLSWNGNRYLLVAMIKETHDDLRMSPEAGTPSHGVLRAEKEGLSEWRFGQATRDYWE